MSGAKVHHFCGVNFQDLTNILNKLSYEKMVDYIRTCIEAREKDYSFHEKKLNEMEDIIKEINNDIKSDTDNMKKEKTQKNIDSGYIKYLENSIKYFFDKRKKIQNEIDDMILLKITHVSVINALKLRLNDIIKYYKLNNIKPLLYLPETNFVFDIKYSSNKAQNLSAYIINVPTKGSKSKKHKKQTKHSKGSHGSKRSKSSRGSRGSKGSIRSIRNKGKK